MGKGLTVPTGSWQMAHERPCHLCARDPVGCLSTDWLAPQVWHSSSAAGQAWGCMLWATCQFRPIEDAYCCCSLLLSDKAVCLKHRLLPPHPEAKPILWHPIIKEPMSISSGFDPTDPLPLLPPPSPHLQLPILATGGLLWKSSPFIKTMGLIRVVLCPWCPKLDSPAPPCPPVIRSALIFKRICHPSSSAYRMKEP